VAPPVWRLNANGGVTAEMVVADEARLLNPNSWLGAKAWIGSWSFGKLPRELKSQSSKTV
jgi:hypothetical protein